MTELFRCTIPTRCPVKKNTKKVVRRHGRVLVLYSKQFREWETVAMITLKQAALFHKTITTPIEARFKFYFKNKSAESDLSNLIEGPQDVMTKAGVIEDDRLIQIIHATKHFGEEPRVEISLYDIEASA